MGRLADHHGRAALNLSVCVQHHPRRRDLLPRLLGGIAPAEVVLDPQPEERYGSALRTYLECLRQIPARATHRLVVQDDAIPCPGFVERAQAAIAERPDTLVAFFVPGRTLLLDLMRKEHERGSRWLQLPQTLNWTPTVALCWPVELAHEFIPAAEEMIAARARRGLTTHADDPYVGAWRKEQKYPVWATVPCLVEHPDTVQSLYRPNLRPRAGANRARVAALYLG